MTGLKRNQKRKKKTEKKSVTSNGLGNFFRPEKKQVKKNSLKFMRWIHSKKKKTCCVILIPSEGYMELEKKLKKEPQGVYKYNRK
jgi:hypothetical protein